MNRDALIRYALFVLLFVAGMAALLRILVWIYLPGATVTSWIRSPSKNKQVGGAKRSAHLLGWGVDFIPVTASLEGIARRIFPFVLNEQDHIHIGWY